MVIRMDKGVVRFGLPGLILGIGLAWVSGIRGPEVAAQTGSSRLASGEFGDGSKRQVGRADSAGRRGRSERDLGLDHDSRAVSMAVSRRHQRPRICSLSHRSARIPRGLSSSRLHGSTSGISSWNITTIRLRSPTRSKRRWRLWVVQQNKRRPKT